MGDTKNLISLDAIEKIKDLAESADICHFVTAISKTPLSTRPMSTQKVDDDGFIWFMSDKSSIKNQEINSDSRVQLFYSHQSSSEYLSIFGTAEIIFDRDKIEEMWTPIAKAWFTEGKDDPAISLLKVTPQEGYYWDTKNNKMVALVKIATAIVTGKTMDDGIEGKLTV
ncbi:MAG: pyridoxamine 5'-phosphate oxidase family protein [Ginsengibacter sp.]